MLSHEEAVQHLVEYQFGRLPPVMNAAVEAHVRKCAICQRQGLHHAATEKREIARRIRRLRPGKRKFSVRGLRILLALTLILLAQLVVLKATQGGNLAWLTGGHPTSTQSTLVPTVASSPTPAVLVANRSFDRSSASTAALAISPDGKTVAAASLKNGTPLITLWTAATGTEVSTLPWPGSAVPGTLAWSPDGRMLAAADGSIIVVWPLTTTTPLWILNLPTTVAMRVYDVRAGRVTQEPNPGTAFAQGSFLLWGSDGLLTTAPPGAAGAAGFAVPGNALVGLWQVSGSHVFPGPTSTAFVGISKADVVSHQALMAWSPDGQYLLWGTSSQPVLVSPASSGGAASDATPTTTSTAGVPPPDAIVSDVAQRVAGNGHGDALIWFAPDGRTLATCDRTSTGAPLQVYDIATGNVLFELPAACDHTTLSSLAWLPSSNGLVFAQQGSPIATYPVARPSS